jgi:hypothetical protein
MLSAAHLMPYAVDFSHPKGSLFPRCDFRLQKLFSRKKTSKPKIDSKKNDDLASEIEDKELYVERIRLETMDLRLLSSLTC